MTLYEHLKLNNLCSADTLFKQMYYSQIILLVRDKTSIENIYFLNIMCRAPNYSPESN